MTRIEDYALLSDLETAALVDGDVARTIARDVPLEPAQVLHALLRLRPDSTPAPIERPLTPLLDTTVLTNAPRRAAAPP